MKKGIIVFLLSLIAILYCACTDVEKNSSFSITFIDVGQGDAALVECDGQYMLVDGGDKQYGDRLYQVLKEHIGVGRKLDILAISHLHADHIGGLEEALKCVSSVGITISNADSANTEVFMDVQSALANVNTTISPIR